MNVIPQSPPLKVRVTSLEREPEGWHESGEYLGRIVAWQVQPDGGLADMIPIVWTDGDGQAYALINGTETKHRVAEEEW